jgi:hypothetical protein
MAPTTAAAPTQPSISDMDGHLSAMGFAPPAVFDGGGLAGSSTENAEFDANYLQDWFSGNSSLTEFLENNMTLTPNNDSISENKTLISIPFVPLIF